MQDTNRLSQKMKWENPFISNIWKSLCVKWPYFMSLTVNKYDTDKTNFLCSIGVLKEKKPTPFDFLFFLETRKKNENCILYLEANAVNDLQL